MSNFGSYIGAILSKPASEWTNEELSEIQKLLEGGFKDKLETLLLEKRPDDPKTLYKKNSKVRSLKKSLLKKFKPYPNN